MNNLISVWQELTLARRVILFAATVGMFFAVLSITRFGDSPEEALLYAGLDARTAGDVIAALDQAGANYQIRGDAIYVAETMRDTLRMQLAGQGLPAAGGAGYELLDGLSGFGTTSQMFDAAYWRAKEGELARTILAMPHVRAARVHISQSASTFMRDQGLSASVTVTLLTGQLTAEQADALRHLVASATGNMQAAGVSVIDSVAGLIPAAGDLAGRAGDARAAEIKRNVERLLAARVGPGRAVVEVTVDLLNERESITERVFDPQGRVAISSDNEQSSETSNDRQAAVTVASNLPEGDGAEGGGQSQNSQTRERVNFEVSQTQREILREPGAIRRLTVAVLVDGEQLQADDGTVTWQARDDAEIADLRDLVASAAGIDEARGDRLTLKSLEFMGLPAAGTLVEVPGLPLIGPLDPQSLFQIAVLAMVTIVLLLFVIRPLLLRANTSVAQQINSDTLALQGPEELQPFNGEISDGFSLPGLPMIDFDEHGMVGDMPSDPIARLRRLMGERRAESMEILRNWMETEEERS